MSGVQLLSTILKLDRFKDFPTEYKNIKATREKEHIMSTNQILGKLRVYTNLPWCP